ncbi:E3 ubiquitin protein ligase listerin [Tanacetum coccineum]
MKTQRTLGAVNNNQTHPMVVSAKPTHPLWWLGGGEGLQWLCGDKVEMVAAVVESMVKVWCPCGGDDDVGGMTMPFEDHHSGVASGSSVPSIRKFRAERSTGILRRELETDLMNNGINVTEANGRTGPEADLIVTPGNSGNGVKNTASSGSEHGFVSHGFDLNSGRSNKKRLFSSSRQSRSSLPPVAEEFPWDHPDLNYKLTEIQCLDIKDPTLSALYYVVPSLQTNMETMSFILGQVESIKKISENVAWLSGVSKGHGEWQFNQMLFKDLIDGDGICGLRKCHMIFVPRTFKSFSKDEVFMYLRENLKLTPQSMSEKAVALDELQEMHQQVISSSLLALSTLLDILTSDKHGSENLSSEPKHALKAKTTAISHAEKFSSFC